jgi:hypothetical protein
MRSKVRGLTGRPDTSQITDDDLDDNINDYYQHIFPEEAKPPLLKTWLTQATSPTDDGEYTISTNVLQILEPAMIDGEQISLYQDAKKFFGLYPKDTGSAYCITDPTLVIGTSSKAAVKYSAFTFRIQNYSYSKAAAETALSGDTVPQSKYGAWRIEIDTDGTVYATEASGNSTGYDTAAAAVEGLVRESSARACMGFVTAVNTSGTFVPGTTELDASGVTATFTDHFHSSRNRPCDALYHNEVLYLRPKPDDIFEFKADSLQKPTALSGDSSTPLRAEWGPVIAYGTAMEMEKEQGHDEAVAVLNIVYQYRLSLIRGKRIRQKTHNQRTSPKF